MPPKQEFRFIIGGIIIEIIHKTEDFILACIGCPWPSFPTPSYRAR